MKYEIELSDGTKVKRGEDFVVKKKKEPLAIMNLFYRRKVKYMAMADMKLEGKTLDEIGKKYKLSRERIRQILNQYFPDIDFPNAYHGRPVDPSKRVDITCKQCKKVITVLKSILKSRNITFCSNQCYLDFHGYNKLPVSINRMNPEQFKVWNAARSKSYYHAHKNDPHFKRKIQMYNRRQYIKNHESK